MKETLRNHAPGVAISIVLALAGTVLAKYIPYVGSAMMALLLGALAGNTFMNGKTCAPGLKFVEKRVLEAAIVLTGFGMDALYLQTMESTLIWVIAAMVVTTIVASWVLGRWFKSSPTFSYLLGAGSAICGSSAIAATAPILEASEEETGLALGIVNLLGLFGLVALPALAHVFAMTDVQTATLIGGVLQSLGHVVAAGFSVGEGVGEWATVVKMGRILFMVPLLVAVFFIKRGSGGAKKAKFPVFILLFVVAIVLAQWSAVPEGVVTELAGGGKVLLNIAMAAIGAKIQIKPLLKISRRGILQGAVLFGLQIAIALVLVLVAVDF